MRSSRWVDVEPVQCTDGVNLSAGNEIVPMTDELRDPVLIAQVDFVDEQQNGNVHFLNLLEGSGWARVDSSGVVTINKTSASLSAV